MFSFKVHIFNLATIAFFLVSFPPNSKCSLQGNEVSKWADALGIELWNLGRTVTKSDEIKARYTSFNAQVGKKDPRRLLAEIKENILRMMDRKMDAIKCIQERAEEVAENFNFNRTGRHMYQYRSSKYSRVGEKLTNKTGLPLSLRKNAKMYLKMDLNNDTHFYNLEVNTSYSAVHVPTNVYDREADAAFAIQWSHALDKVFKQNYNSDPALYWQYFGSSSGIMRHYPAKKWKEKDKDLFDCRIRTWYIEAATCTKDAIILIDNSGSMDGMGKHIAALTAYSILETFSNNDYVNVLYYNATTNYTVKCFENMLVQATRENIRTFKEAIAGFKPAGKTDASQALEVAFNLLKSYRERRGCIESSVDCNQAIMLVTDGISGNLSETVIKYNHIGSDIPVRIFTYLIGKEVTNIDEIKWMACANRGYYTHIQSLEQVTVSVLQYINVIARPLVLVDDHPISWTHAYLDLTYEETKNDNNPNNDQYRLLTSVAIPCFDTRINKQNDTRTAYLLGVAATDIPLEDFGKLTLPYKIGVNAYVFIVSNNGYVLMHPDLRPVFQGILAKNFNSIDLTEVEQMDDGLPPRVVGEILTQLRDNLVNGAEGSIHNITIKYHYDNNRRVSKEKFDYYYSPLDNTPFSIAVAIPNLYGNYSLDVGDEIKRNEFTPSKLTDWFQGENWKIHPKWAYCKYHYLEGHEFDTPELELLHFLGKMYDRDFEWNRQYEAVKKEHDSDFDLEKENLNGTECGRKTHNDNDYYCDRQLIQRLVFDAKNTQEAFNGPWKFQSGEKVLFERYNVTLRFVATMSGLTRWEYISEAVENSTKKEFGDYHSRAINEMWYKSAVIQHKYDTESFIFAVPFEEDVEGEIMVTGSYAIFPSEAGHEAPGSVVGYQFPQSNLKTRFRELSNKLSNQCPECGMCNTTLDCYIIDHSGYIIVSEQDEHTAKFFGEIEGDILEIMLEETIFEKVVIYDFQSLCNIHDDHKKSDASAILTPMDYIQKTFNWLLINIFWILSEIHLHTLIDPVVYLAEEIITLMEGEFSSLALHLVDDEDYPAQYVDSELIQEVPIIIGVEDEEDNDEQSVVEEIDENDYYACEKKIELYNLQQELFTIGNYHGEVMKLGKRPFYIKRIPHSNLFFVAVNSTVVNQSKRKYSTKPEKIVYENVTTYPCQKLNLNNFTRRRLQGCFNEHPLEHEILDCGKGSRIVVNMFLLLISLVSLKITILICF